jgi:indole-3-glycerol phosphate synthase
MADILSNILASKKHEVALQKERVPIHDLEKSQHFTRPCYSLRKALLLRPGCAVIAEFKRKSPSRAAIHTAADALPVCTSYVRAGAIAVSVLTDEPHFGGRPADLESVRNHISVPLLRKDFVVDEYQVLEAKALGADVILLIAAALSRNQVKHFTGLAHSLGMEVLLEIHTRQEWEDYGGCEADVVGVNNRNLHTLKVDLSTSIQLADVFPPELVRISESGINHPEEACSLAACGYHGFLIGEQFMRQPDPGRACEYFVERLNAMLHGL